MPSLREILAGYEAANAWEREEERERLPRLSIDEGVRQYLELIEMTWRLAPEAESCFLGEKLAHYEALHRRMERAAAVMGRVGPN
jgi:hypothetical protein